MDTLDIPPESRPLVLLVEDFRDAREMYEYYLTAHGYDIAMAEDGHQGLRVAVDRLPGVIVMDLGLPGIDGWTLIQLLKNDARTRAIPIVVLSAHTMPVERQRALDAGCDRFVPKPCLPADLAKEVASALVATSAPASPRAR